MRIIQCDSKDEAVKLVAGLLLDKLTSLPLPVIGLATGQTMVPVYKAFVDMTLNSEQKLNKAFFFLLDEYLGLPENHPSSFKSYIKQHLIDPLSLRESQFAFPPVHSSDGAAHYETSIKESLGIDLQLLGIGRNGHIGFNEPGSGKETRTRKVKLTDETIAANREQLKEGTIPFEALSMGIGTILEAKMIVMLATGQSKAEAIKFLVNHHDDPNCPATFLKDHAHFTLVLDPEAASKINLNI